MKNLKRREFLKLSALSLIFLSAQNSMASILLSADEGEQLADFVIKNQIKNPGNFQAIYGNPQLKERFYSFLVNVYNIYPEERFHRLIDEATQAKKGDEEVYNYILDNLSAVKTLLSELNYALPALSKQKQEIAQQTVKMLDKDQIIDGYLEIGTPGRYVADLKKQLKIKGKTFLINVTKPNFSPMDIAERGGLLKAGNFVALNNYEPIKSESIAENSMDLVTNYIGFHHSPIAKLEDFILSVRKVIKPGGTFILREHDVTGENMNHIVALAHDVFNVGLKVNWEVNHHEVRNFRSIKNWIDYLEKRGFKYQNQIIFQKGDPTKNGLIKFIKL